MYNKQHSASSFSYAVEKRSLYSGVRYIVYKPYIVHKQKMSAKHWQGEHKQQMLHTKLGISATEYMCFLRIVGHKCIAMYYFFYCRSFRHQMLIDTTNKASYFPPRHKCTCNAYHPSIPPSHHGSYFFKQRKLFAGQQHTTGMKTPFRSKGQAQQKPVYLCSHSTKTAANIYAQQEDMPLFTSDKNQAGAYFLYDVYTDISSKYQCNFCLSEGTGCCECMEIM